MRIGGGRRDEEAAEVELSEDKTSDDDIGEDEKVIGEGEERSREVSKRGRVSATRSGMEGAARDSSMVTL